MYNTPMTTNEQREEAISAASLRLGHAIQHYHQVATGEAMANGMDAEKARFAAVGATITMTLEGLMMLYLREERPADSESDASLFQVFGTALTKCVVDLAKAVPALRKELKSVETMMAKKHPTA